MRMYHLILWTVYLIFMIIYLNSNQVAASFQWFLFSGISIHCQVEQQNFILLLKLRCIVCITKENLHLGHVKKLHIRILYASCKIIFIESYPFFLFLIIFSKISLLCICQLIVYFEWERRWIVWILFSK